MCALVRRDDETERSHCYDILSIWKLLMILLFAIPRDGETISVYIVKMRTY